MKKLLNNIDPDGWLPYLLPIFIVCIMLIAWMTGELIVHGMTGG